LEIVGIKKTVEKRQSSEGTKGKGPKSPKTCCKNDRRRDQFPEGGQRTHGTPQRWGTDAWSVGGSPGQETRGRLRQRRREGWTGRRGENQSRGGIGLARKNTFTARGEAKRPVLFLPGAGRGTRGGGEQKVETGGKKGMSLVPKGTHYSLSWLHLGGV